MNTTLKNPLLAIDLSELKDQKQHLITWRNMESLIAEELALLSNVIHLYDSIQTYLENKPECFELFIAWGEDNQRNACRDNWDLITFDDCGRYEFASLEEKEAFHKGIDAIPGDEPYYILTKEQYLHIEQLNS